MTAAERAKPRSSTARAASASPRVPAFEVYDVNQLLKQFAETRKLMKQFQGMSGKGKRRMKFPGLPGGF